MPIRVFAVEDTSWSETDITWDNAPKKGQLLDSAVVSDSGQWISFDVTSYFPGIIDTAKGVSFCLEVSNGEGEIAFSSREAFAMPYLEIASQASKQTAYHDESWNFPGDTVVAWQYDRIWNSFIDTLFAFDSGYTIGLYGCDATGGQNIRSYTDAAQFPDAAQFQWDEHSQTFKKNGQWIEYTGSFTGNTKYQLVLRARAQSDAGCHLTILDGLGNIAYADSLRLPDDFTNIGGGTDATDWYVSDFEISHLSGTNVVRFDWYDQVGEPGVFGAFSFVTSKFDQTPPELFFVSEGPVIQGNAITAISTENGMVYLVPAGTPADAAIIKEKAISSAAAVSYQEAELSTTGVNAGEYIVYALDSAQNVSPVVAGITVTDIIAPTLRNVTEGLGITISYEAAYDQITIRSASNLEQVTIYNILGNVVLNKTCNSNACIVQTDEFQSGTYIVRVVSQQEKMLQKIMIF